MGDTNCPILLRTELFFEGFCDSGRDFCCCKMAADGVHRAPLVAILRALIQDHHWSCRFPPEQKRGRKEQNGVGAVGGNGYGAKDMCRILSPPAAAFPPLCLLSHVLAKFRTTGTHCGSGSLQRCKGV